MKIFKAAVMLSVVAAGIGSFSAGPVAAFPLGPAIGGLAAQLDNATPAVPVYYRGWGYRGWGYRGGGLAAGLIGSAIVGGIIASQGPYYYGSPGYYGSLGYYGYGAPYGAYRAYPYAGSAVGYCLSRFKSYNPASGTYLGYDGRRHSCP